MSDEPEIDVERQVSYWREGALETWKDVAHCMKGDRIALAMFLLTLLLKKR